MPLKLTVGLSKKLGLPDYGSLGALCQLELELDQSLLEDDLDAFHQQVRDTYTACRQAVQDELARQSSSDKSTNQPSRSEDATAESQPATTQEQRSSGNGNGHYAASEKQLSYISQLARQIKGLGVRRLETLAQEMFGKQPAELSSFEASALIDQLKALKSGELNLEEVLTGSAA
jgi:hypothetical protein